MLVFEPVGEFLLKKFQNMHINYYFETIYQYYVVLCIMYIYFVQQYVVSWNFKLYYEMKFMKYDNTGTAR